MLSLNSLLGLDSVIRLDKTILLYIFLLLSLILCPNFLKYVVHIETCLSKLPDASEQIPRSQLSSWFRKHALRAEQELKVGRVKEIVVLVADLVKRLYTDLAVPFFGLRMLSHLLLERYLNEKVATG